MFQIMCNANTSIDFKTVATVLTPTGDNLKYLQVVKKPQIYERGGFKKTLEYNDYNDIGDEAGSMQLMCIHKTVMNKVSFLIFKNGKVRISGGLSSVKENQQQFIDQIIGDIMNVITTKSCDYEYNITLLNAQYKLSELNVKCFRRFLFEASKSNKFHKVFDPVLKGKGRISVGKVYSYEKRKSHISVDSNGLLQFMAYKSFQEIELQLSLVKDILFVL